MEQPGRMPKTAAATMEHGCSGRIFQSSKTVPFCIIRLHAGLANTEFLCGSPFLNDVLGELVCPRFHAAILFVIL